jgi:putative phage-type endonuclease
MKITNNFRLRTFDNKEAWTSWCHNGLTPEDTAVIMGENPWGSVEELLARKTGAIAPEKEVTQAMLKGREHRPKATQAYQKEHPECNLTTANLESTSLPWLRSNVDLFDIKTLHIAEVRCGESAYEKAKDKSFPPKPYWAEAQHILAVTGLKYLQIYFHTPTEEKPPITIKVWRKEEYISRMIQESKKFMESIQSGKSLLEAKLRTEQVKKAKEALEEERNLARSVYEAIVGKAPKVDKDTYQKYVPTHFDRRGRLTPLGESLLLQNS